MDPKKLELRKEVDYPPIYEMMKRIKLLTFS